MGEGTVTEVDARDGMAGKGLDTQDRATGFELRTRTQLDALELDFAQT